MLMTASFVVSLSQDFQLRISTKLCTQMRTILMMTVYQFQNLHRTDWRF